VKVLVTGANGFIGKHLVTTLLDARHKVVAACKPDTAAPPDWIGALEVVSLELSDLTSVQEAVRVKADAIIHLAGISYTQDAEKNPAEAWNVIVGGTKRLLDAINAEGMTGDTGPRVLVTSSAEAVVAYALAAWGMPVIIVRPFPATGPGQTNRLVPNWLGELQKGKREIEGDSNIVRDFTDVRDTAAGYVALLARGRPGETYNIASGREVRFGELFAKLTETLGIKARLVPPSKPRPGAPYLVGDPSKLQRHTGWQPTIPLGQTLSDLIDAQAH
jgi:GDP-4-dehydro-6-deoxy-D-mannose reductase